MRKVNLNEVSILKKTKIVCTIGPKTESVEILKELLNRGMNVMRLKDLKSEL